MGARGNVAGVDLHGELADLTIDVYGFVDRTAVESSNSDYESTDTVLLSSPAVTVSTFLTSVAGERLFTPIDVTGFVRDEVAKGNSVIAFRLQIGESGLPNSDGVVNRYTLHTADHATNQPFLQIVPAWTYETWKQENFTVDEQGQPEISGPGADPDGRGITNLVRYGLRISADASDRDALPAPTILTDDPLRGCVVFFREAGATDLHLEVESSADLVAWHADDGNQLVRRSMLPDGRERWVVGAPDSVTGSPTQFFRIKMELIP